MVGADLRRIGMRLVVGGVRIGGENDMVAVGGGAARGGVDAELGRVAAYHHAFHATEGQHFFQAGAQERIRRGLAHAMIPGFDLQTLVQAPAGRIDLQVARTLMLDEDHRRPGRARPYGQPVDMVDDGIGIGGARQRIE